MRTSSSKLLCELADVGANDYEPPGSEWLAVDTDSADDKEAIHMQQAHILRRVGDVETVLPECGKKAYTWRRATLRLSAALAFDKKFSPLVRSLSTIFLRTGVFSSRLLA